MPLDDYELPPELLIACLQSAEDRQDPLLSSTFSVEAALDELFPDEQSLADVDVVQMRLRSRVQEQRQLLDQLKSTLSNSEEDAKRMAAVQELVGVRAPLLLHPGSLSWPERSCSPMSITSAPARQSQRSSFER